MFGDKYVLPHPLDYLSQGLHLSLKIFLLHISQGFSVYLCIAILLYNVLTIRTGCHTTQINALPDFFIQPVRSHLFMSLPIALPRPCQSYIIFVWIDYSLVTQFLMARHLKTFQSFALKSHTLVLISVMKRNHILTFASMGLICHSVES